MFWPLAALRGGDARRVVLLRRSAHQSQRLQAAGRSSSSSPSPIDCFRGGARLTVVDVIITVGAISAVIGIVQFGILNFDNLGRRPQGTLGHYMTYSGRLMLVACTAVARVMFRQPDRMWAALVLPAVLVALVLTLSRNAWVGACAGIGTALPAPRLPAGRAAAGRRRWCSSRFAPAAITDRLYSTLPGERAGDTAPRSSRRAVDRDRIAMMKSGLHIIKDDPLTGVGPDMVISGLPALPRADGRQPAQPAPPQRARCRSRPSVGCRRSRSGCGSSARWCATSCGGAEHLGARARHAGARACVVAMMAAGMFEYNFGDSEFLMLFLVLVTLPYAAERAASRRRTVADLAAHRSATPRRRLAGRTVLISSAT